MMARRTFLFFLPVLAFFLLLAPRRVGAQGNLLQNPGFEAGFYYWSGINEIHVGNNWTPWWIENPDHDPTYFRPEYKHAWAVEYPARVHGGQSAQQWFKLYSSFFAGLYQQVFDVTAGQNYRFSIWALVWSSTEDNPPNVSTLPANPHLQVGIDPTGGWDPFSPDVIWSGEAGMNSVVDSWGQIGVEAVAENNVITVFVRSRPEFANKHNNVYIDDALLAAVGDPQPTAPPPTDTPIPATAVPTASPAPPETATSPPAFTRTPEPSPIPSTTALPPSSTPTSSPTNAPLPTASATITPSPTPSPTFVPSETSSPTVTTTAEATETPTLPAPAATDASGAAEGTEIAAAEDRGDPEQALDSGAEEGGSGPRLCASPILLMALLGIAKFSDKRRRRANRFS